MKQPGTLLSQGFCCVGQGPHVSGLLGPVGDPALYSSPREFLLCLCPKTNRSFIVVHEAYITRYTCSAF